MTSRPTPTSLPSPLLLCLPIQDRRRAYAFYGPSGLGLPTPGEPADDGVPEPLQVVVCDGVRLMLVPGGGFEWVTGRPAPPPETAACLLALSCPSADEVDTLVQRMAAAGGAVVADAADRGWGYSAVVADPDGHLWQIAVTPA